MAKACEGTMESNGLCDTVSDVNLTKQWQIMGVPKVVDVFEVYRGDVVVCTEANGVRNSWTITDDAIFGGGVIFGLIETEHHNMYRRRGDQWQSHTLEVGSQKVSDEIAVQLCLVEQAAV
jgi:hypothetical protein